jgi:hypothetical protein
VKLLYSKRAQEAMADPETRKRLLDWLHSGDLRVTEKGSVTVSASALMKTEQFRAAMSAVKDIRERLGSA